MTKTNKQMSCLSELLDGYNADEVQKRYSKATFDRAMQMYKRMNGTGASGSEPQNDSLSLISRSVGDAIGDGELSDGWADGFKSGLAVGLRAVFAGAEGLTRISGSGQTAAVENVLALTRQVQQQSQPQPQQADPGLVNAINSLNSNVEGLSKPRSGQEMIWDAMSPFIQGMMSQFMGGFGMPQQQPGQGEAQPGQGAGEMTDNERQEVFGNG